MGVYTYESEVPTTIPPKKFFKAFILDANNFFPKIIPHGAYHTEILEGDGIGVGTVKKINFGEGSHLKYVKHKIEKIDEENLEYHYSTIEGEPLSEYVDKIVHKIKIVASHDGGSILKTHTTYHTKSDNELDKEKTKAGEEKGLALLKAAEAYLQAHPHEY